MFDAAISSLFDELKQFIDLRFRPSEPKLVLSSLIQQDGTIAIPGENLIVMTLVDIEEDRFQGYKPKKVPADNGGYIRENHPIHLNLYLLFSAFFEPNSTLDGIKMLAAVMGFFQSKYIFTPLNTPSLADTDIEKLIVELSPTNFQDKSYLWGMLGAKYLPSALYRVRMITLQSGQQLEGIPEIRKVDNEIERS